MGRELGGHVVNRAEPKDRDIAMAFKKYAIYPFRAPAVSPDWNWRVIRR